MSQETPASVTENVMPKNIDQKWANEEISDSQTPSTRSEQNALDSKPDELIDNLNSKTDGDANKNFSSEETKNKFKISKSPEKSNDPSQNIVSLLEVFFKIKKHRFLIHYKELVISKYLKPWIKRHEKSRNFLSKSDGEVENNQYKIDLTKNKMDVQSDIAMLTKIFNGLLDKKSYRKEYSCRWYYISIEKLTSSRWFEMKKYNNFR